MAKFASERNMKFLLYEVHDAQSITSYPFFSQHNKKAFDMILDAAARLARDLYRPSFEEMDRRPPYLEDGEVRVHQDVRGIMEEAGEGGWISARFPADMDGGQLPAMVTGAAEFYFSAANYSASVYPHLTAGAAYLLVSFGSRDLIDTYVPDMLAGRWQGTMALTEPQAGSSLSDVETSATPTDEGHYIIRGRKIFISGGDHDGVDNVVHLMLARIDGAPAGVKGISLFAVPKLRPEGGGLVPNDVNVSQVYHKMGYRGCPITELAIGDRDDCRGWLVGEPNRGLSYMFQMMNGARLGVGAGATSIASAAYYAALDYAKQRPQGRRLMQKDPTKPQIPIIEHADVKRMLLFQRAVVEGALSLIMQCYRYEDLERAAEGEEKERAHLLLEILTPIAKSYPSEMGIQATSAAIQCLGGYGYCQDFPVEQHFRDMRIHPIHEGTTGIQGMDLLGRKVVMQEGRALLAWAEEVGRAIAEARGVSELAGYADRLEAAMKDLQEVTLKKTQLAMEKGAEVFLADAALYLEMFGHVAIAWQWLRQAVAAHKGLDKKSSGKEGRFYQGKLACCRYFFAYELVRCEGLRTRLLEDDGFTVELDARTFDD
ncbi:MAG: acyl-CoA dehydrogenase [Desulfatibacillaceae bacterium]